MEKEDGLGLIQIYTGDGKGKTTAALGLAMRAAGHDFKIAIIQFMKIWNYG
ncbi:cob(I)yrinic acid a,c-diamide adenosyltransferase, partial [bacterium]|nr:cob(I)yrinic acid a,c-diamide adenosyltransferase [bacterium]